MASILSRPQCVKGAFWKNRGLIPHRPPLAWTLHTWGKWWTTTAINACKFLSFSLLRQVPYAPYVTLLFPVPVDNWSWKFVHYFCFCLFAVNTKWRLSSPVVTLSRILQYHRRLLQLNTNPGWSCVRRYGVHANWPHPLSIVYLTPSHSATLRRRPGAALDFTSLVCPQATARTPYSSLTSHGVTRLIPPSGNPCWKPSVLHLHTDSSLRRNSSWEKGNVWDPLASHHMIIMRTTANSSSQHVVVCFIVRIHWERILSGWVPESILFCDWQVKSCIMQLVVKFSKLLTTDIP